MLAIVAAESADRFFFQQAAVAAAARIEGLKSAGVDALPWRGEARIAGIDWRRGGASLHVGALTFTAHPFVSLAGAALAGGEAASADDVTLETGFSVYKFNRIDLAGASLSSAALMQLFDSKSPLPLAEKLAKLSAAKITIPEMTVENKIGTSAQKFLYRDIALKGVAAGKAADVTIAGLSFSVSDPQTGEAEGAYGKISARDVDLVLGARITSETRDRADAPKLALCAAISIDAFHYSGAESALDVKNGAAKALMGRPPLKPWREAAAAPASSAAAPRSVFLAALLDSFGFDDATAANVRLDLRKDGNAASLTMALLSIKRFDGPRIDAVEARNIAFENPSGRTSLETLGLRGLDLRPLMNPERAPNFVGEDLRPNFDYAALTKLESRRASVEEADTRPGSRFEMERFEVESIAPRDATPPVLNVSFNHFTAPAGEGGAFPTLAAMGYARLDLSGRLNVIWKEESGELAINSFSLDGAGMGSLLVAAQFSNVTLALASKDGAIAGAAARGIRIKKLDLHVENAGLVDRALAVQARNQKQSIDEARQSDILKASLLLPALLGNEPRARALGSAIAKFIAAPKSFTLQARAPEGIGLADLELVQTPGAVLKKIDVQASANP